MADSDFRPYAATANVLAVIERCRTRNLPETLTHDFLGLTGIPEVVYGRVWQALKFLDLVHDDGRPTDHLQALAKAPDAELPQVLAACIREAYREDFDRVDPERDGQTVIIDAFRRYQPRSQTSRMVMLFLGLCRAGGIPIIDAPRERKMQTVDSQRKQASAGARPARGTKFPRGEMRPSFFDHLVRDTPRSLFAHVLGRERVSYPLNRPVMDRLKVKVPNMVGEATVGDNKRRQGFHA